MKILIGIDSIKTFENSVEIGNVFKNNMNEDVTVMPFLDGGDGTVEAMQAVIKGKYKYVNVHNPLNDVITARYILKDDLAVMEMAESSGIRLLYKEDLRVMESSSLGFGEMILDGLDNGAKSFYIGIGDTATNDLGMGMLYALGARFYDPDDRELNPIAENMERVAKTDISGLDRRLKDVKIVIATSTFKTLFGENSFLEDRVYRKGASDLDTARLFKGSKHFKKIIEDELGTGSVDMPGLGSGGGVAWALYLFFKVKITKSMDFMMKTLDFEKLIRDKDVLILGENVEQFGAYSSQNVAKLAKRYNKDLEIIFLEDSTNKRVEDKGDFDKIISYKLGDAYDRQDMYKEIGFLAKRVESLL
ncbi:glycerate kinase [Anaerococcus sp. NML200537]|uniref:glycerate kinase n=1 Tax=Anaerococcus sp. NML200537 TaxID=2954485 RepID=UPI002237B1E0|nr:glycerate kinase [Anaerococcus sp. NML200537]MCW6702254.1 glycerate kinase [Anaerococcus sp. NML200537]